MISILPTAGAGAHPAAATARTAGNDGPALSQTITASSP